MNIQDEENMMSDRQSQDEADDAYPAHWQTGKTDTPDDKTPAPDLSDYDYPSHWATARNRNH